MTKQNFILLPLKTTIALKSEDKTLNPKVSEFFYRMSSSSGRAKPMTLARRVDKPLPVKVVDSVSDEGAKLVELHLDSLPDFQLAYPGMRLVPEVFYKRALIPPFAKSKPITVAAATKRATVVTVTTDQGVPIKDAEVHAFTNYNDGVGLDGETNSKGRYTINLSRSIKKLDVLLIYPPHSYWPVCLRNVSLNAPIDVPLRPLDITFKDALRHFYNTKEFPVIRKQIKVGVIDTGVGPHSSIEVAGGECTIAGSNKKDFKDCDHHGTHVAGIIASKHDPIGVASGVDIYAYRVFSKNGDASNFSIIKAIVKAVEDGCLLINLSLELGEPDEATSSQIAEAYSKGVICFAATGNGYHDRVAHPAAYSLTIGVGAMGRKGTFPPGSEPFIDIKAPYGSDRKNFIGAFSNIGPQVKMTAPGVGIISCYPGDKFRVLSGTSMACPAATGIAARLLAMEGKIIKRAPNAQRADEMVKFLHANLKTFGFGPRYEGKGMLVV